MDSLSGFLPFVSIILPLRNEVKSIAGCLQQVFQQDYPAQRMEVLVADGLSTDGTADVLRVLQKDHSNLVVLENPGQIVPTGLNLAIRKAKGDIIIRVDGHTRIAPDYVQQCVALLGSCGADNVGGRMNAAGQGAFGMAVAAATSSPFGVGGARFHYSDEEEWVDTVYMGAWPRQVFTRIGLFDEELVRDQDDEFNYRLRENGGRILLSPKIKSWYTVRSTPKALWNQYFQYGYWKVRVLQKHPRQMSLRQFVPTVFVMALLGSLTLALFTPLGRWLFMLTAGSYLLANLTASFITANRMVKTSRKGWFYLPVTYAILHLGYGLGFLVGLVKFANRWGDKKGKVPDFSMPDA
jgi:succinoglycan biosynthesis protein ExoA